MALTVLAAERLDAGNLGLANADQAVELARNLGRPLELVERDRVADLITRSYVQRITGMRVAEAIVAGQEPGPEASVGKLLATDTMSTTSEVVRLLLGPELTVDSGRWGTWAWTEHVLGRPVIASPGAPTRSNTTSWPNGSSACRRSGRRESGGVRFGAVKAVASVLARTRPGSTVEPLRVLPGGHSGLDVSGRDLGRCGGGEGRATRGGVPSVATT